MKRFDLERLRTAYPDLTLLGLCHLGGGQHIVDSINQDQIEMLKRVTAFLQTFPKRKTFATAFTSYGFKHTLEKKFGYMPNGVMIAAIFFAGFNIKRFGANAMFNMLITHKQRSNLEKYGDCEFNCSLVQSMKL